MELTTKILNDYQNKTTKKVLMQKYSITYYDLTTLLKVNGIELQKYTYSNKTRIRNIDLDCFKSINTTNKAYLLGLLLSDGTIDNNGYGFQFSSKDRELLEYAKEILKSEHKIVDVNTFDKRTNKTYQRFSIKFSSKEMVNDLQKLGLTNNKGETVKVPNIDIKYHWDLVRGIFDGDGSIHYTVNKKSGQLRFSIIGSIDTIIWLENFFQQQGLTIRKRMEVKTQTGNMYRIIFSAYRDLKFIRDNMYNNADYYLQRKYELFQTLREYTKGCYLSNKNKVWKKVKGISRNNEIIIFDNIPACKKYFELERCESIRRVINGERKTYKGWKFEYV